MTDQTLRFSFEVHVEDEPYSLIWIPTKTAQAVHRSTLNDPAYVNSTDEYGIIDIAKRVDSDSGQNTFHLENLDAYDWSILNKAWIDLPALRLPMREKDFKVYEIAFKAFEQPQQFTLEAIGGRIGLHLQQSLHSTVYMHQAELQQWVLDGKVIPRDRTTRLETPHKWVSTSGLLLPDLQAFAQSLQIDVQIITRGANNSSMSLTAKQCLHDERQKLLEEFRSMGGRLPSVDKEKGIQGVLSKMARAKGVNRSSLKERLTRAIQEKNSSQTNADVEDESRADVWAQLRK